MKKLPTLLQKGANLAPPLRYSSCFVAAPLVSLLLLLCYCSCFATPFTSLLFVLCCSFYFAIVCVLLLLFMLHCCYSCFIVPPTSLLFLLHFIVVPFPSLLLLLHYYSYFTHCCSLCFTTTLVVSFFVLLTSLLMLLRCSSFVHRYYAVLCCSVALPSSFLPLVALLLLCASCFIVIQCFVVPFPKLVFPPPPNPFFLQHIGNLKLFGRKLRNIQANSKFLLFFTCLFYFILFYFGFPSLICFSIFILLLCDWIFLFFCYFVGIFGKSLRIYFSSFIFALVINELSYNCL